MTKELREKWREISGEGLTPKDKFFINLDINKLNGIPIETGFDTTFIVWERDKEKKGLIIFPSSDQDTIEKSVCFNRVQFKNFIDELQSLYYKKSDYETFVIKLEQEVEK